jgi:hypothetical protein
MNDNEKLKRCPICGHFPELDIRDMGRGNGHGYPGHDSYTYSCPYCDVIGVHGADTVYTDDDKVRDEAIEAWNTAVESIEKLFEEKERVLEKKEAQSNSDFNPFAKQLLIAMVKGEDVKLTSGLLKKLLDEIEKL